MYGPGIGRKAVPIVLGNRGLLRVGLSLSRSGSIGNNRMARRRPNIWEGHVARQLDGNGQWPPQSAARRYAQALGVMRLGILAAALFLASCASTTLDHERHLADISVARSSGGVLNLTIHNGSSRSIEYAWPLAMSSDDRSPVACPLPTHEFEYEEYLLKPHATAHLKLDGWDRDGYVGIWVREARSNEWSLAWSGRPLQ